MVASLHVVQFALHDPQTVSVETEQAVATYLPLPQVEQAAQTVSVVAPHAVAT